MSFKLQRSNTYPIVFGSLGACVVIAPFIFDWAAQLSFILPAITTISGLAAFFYSKHSRDIELFRQLFREFNEKYDELNAQVNEIIGRAEGDPLKPTYYGVLYDYFNLCAEEAMFADAGCIDDRVWQAWRNGMIFVAKDPEIRELWERELTQNSYYGFKIPKAKNKA